MASAFTEQMTGQYSARYSEFTKYCLKLPTRNDYFLDTSPKGFYTTYKTRKTPGMDIAPNFCTVPK